MKIMKEILLGGVVLIVIALSILLTVKLQSSPEKSGVKTAENLSTENTTENFSSENGQASGGISEESMQETSSDTVQNDGRTVRQSKPAETVTASAPPAVDKKNENTCTLEIRCDVLSKDLSQLIDPAKAAYVPGDGAILHKMEVVFEEGENVYHLLLRICREQGIPVSSSYTEEYKAMYVRGINNIFEFEGGEFSGWLYSVNGVYPKIGSSLYLINKGDTVLWEYTLSYKGMW